MLQYPPFGQLRLEKESERVRKNTLAGDKTARLNVYECYFSSFALLPSPFSMLLDGAKKLPRPALCSSERTLMCDFPSTCHPKWIGTSTIIFCHYSFRSRHCAEIQTILAVQYEARKEISENKGSERERGWKLCDYDRSKDGGFSRVKSEWLTRHADGACCFLPLLELFGRN